MIGDCIFRKKIDVSIGSFAVHDFSIQLQIYI